MFSILILVLILFCDDEEIFLYFTSDDLKVWLQFVPFALSLNTIDKLSVVTSYPRAVSVVNCKPVIDHDARVLIPAISDLWFEELSIVQDDNWYNFLEDHLSEK
jgi:hypothetical protein